MALKHALLAVLEQSPKTGYEVKSLFDGPLEHMWSASFGGIYPALHKMLLGGLITEQFVVQQGKPNKRVYRITPQGTKELQRWYSSPPQPEAVKDEFLLKMYLLPDSDIFTMETLLAERKSHSEDKLSYFSSTKQKNKKNYFVDYSIHRYQSELDWIRQVLGSLQTKTK